MFANCYLYKMSKICKNSVLILIGLLISISNLTFAQDSTSYSSQKAVKNSTLNKFIAPAALMATGLFIHETNGSFSKYKIQTNIQENFAIQSTADDYIQYYPFIAFAVLKGLRKPGANPGNKQIFLLAKSQLLMASMVYVIKVSSKTPRPDGAAGTRSFPSGHTSMSFASAAFLYKEYHDTNKLIAWSGYLLATTTGFMRVMNDEHWMSDIAFGAGLGILCTELIYLHHNRTRKNKDQTSSLMVLPQVGSSKLGFTLDYKF